MKLTPWKTNEERRRREEVAQVAARVNFIEAFERSLLALSITIFFFTLTAITTTDKQLLIATDQFSLPIINTTTNIVYFFASAPIIILIIHELSLQRLRAIPIISASNFKTKNKTKRVQLSHSYVCILGAPLAISVILWRFADYQSESILFLHAVLFFAATFLSFRELKNNTALPPDATKKYPRYLFSS